MPLFPIVCCGCYYERLPAALSTGIGSETSKPLAMVVIGGLISATILTLFIFPIVFFVGYRNSKEKLD